MTTERDLEQAAGSVDAEAMLAHIRVLASDRFEGRGPGTNGEQLTVDYLTETFRQLGLKPGNPDGSYVQSVPFVGSRAASELSFEVGGQRVELKPLADFVAGTAWQVPEIVIDRSPLVFVGYGVVAPEYRWDDYKGVDVRGKTVVMLPNDPQVRDPRDAEKLDESLFRAPP